MSDGNLDSIARRWAALVADGRGRWLPGMHTARGLCVVLVGLNSDRMVLQDGYGIDDDDVPDWDHHGTTGGLLALVRLAHGLPFASAHRVCIGAGSAESIRFPKDATLLPSGGWVLYGWQVDDGDGKAIAGIQHRDELTALLAALEAAPKGAK